MDVINTSGRRKTSVARIYMKPGKGEVTVNKRPAAEYFTTGVLQYKVNQPFAITETEGQYDVNVNVYGGGITGQAEAVRLAVSKALIEVNPEWKSALKAEGLTTRDHAWWNARSTAKRKHARKNSSRSVDSAVQSLFISIRLASKHCGPALQLPWCCSNQERKHHVKSFFRTTA